MVCSLTSAATPVSITTTNVANTWQVNTHEFTTNATLSEPTSFLLGFGAKVAGNTVELEYLKIYKKQKQSGSCEYQATGSYVVPVKDMGQRITANIASHFISTNILSAGSSAILQFRTSVDDVYWTPWRDFVPVLATFRYIEFRVLLSSVDGTNTPEVNLLTDIIDVPDKDKYGIAIVPVGGLWIHFDPNSTDASPLNFFYQQPSVVATANEQGKYAVVDESLVSLYRFKVVVYNSSGTDVGGKIMWIAKGY